MDAFFSEREPWKRALVSELAGGQCAYSEETKVHGAPFVIVRAFFRWALTVVLGLCVALTGVYIAYCCDFLADARFGYCQHLLFADKKRCCGGVENFDDIHQRCREPGIKLLIGAATPNWVPWEEVFGLESHLTSLGGYIVAFVVYLLTCVSLTSLACYLVQVYSPQARGSGIPEVKAAVGGFSIPEAFQPVCLVIKSVCLSLAVGAGLSLGKEGPLIHVGVCWAHLLSTLSSFPSHSRLRQALQGIPRNELAAIGAATGVSTAFGAPLGGVLFAVEELGSVRQLSKRCLILCFLGSFSSSFCLKYMNLSGSNSILFFSPSASRNEWLANDLWCYVFLGLLGGLWGAAFVHMNCRVAKWRKYHKEGRLWMFPKSLQRSCLNLCSPSVRWLLTDEAGKFTPTSRAIIEGLLVACITALINFPFSRLLKILSVEAINALFTNCPTDGAGGEKAVRLGLCPQLQDNVSGTFGAASSDGWFLALHLVLVAAIRLLLTVITFGVSVPSGLFIPSLFIGACLGRAVGTVLVIVADKPIHLGSFALVGAASMLGGFSRLTVSLTVIMFELTGESTMVVPVMCACLTSKVVGDYFNDSIYDEHAILSGFAIVEDLPDHVRFDAACSDVMEVIDTEYIIDTSHEVQFSHLAGLLDDPISTSSSSSVHERAKAPPSIMLLSRGMPLSKHIYGALEADLLRQWVSSSECGDVAPDGTAALTFARVRQGPSLGINTPNFASMPSNRRVDMVSRQNTLTTDGGEDFSPHSVGSRPSVVTTRDLSHFVDTHIAKVDAQAPVSVCYFIFHQNPRLKCIVCLGSTRVGVITRHKFIGSVCNGLAYPPLGPMSMQRSGILASIASAEELEVGLLEHEL